MTRAVYSRSGIGSEQPAHGLIAPGGDAAPIQEAHANAPTTGSRIPEPLRQSASGSPQVRSGRNDLRVAFYSHDTFGLGHLNRCIKIASGLTEFLGHVDGIFLTGLPHTDLFENLLRFNFVHLPPVTKLTEGGYAPREAGASYAEVRDCRRQLIRETLHDFGPDLVVVDNVPCGLDGEVIPGLAEAKARGARIVLALRDILDEPDVINADELQTLFGGRRSFDWAIKEDNGAIGPYPAFPPFGTAARNSPALEPGRHEPSGSRPATIEGGVS